MHTSYGKLAALAFCLLLACLLLAPMRAGQEDQLMLSPVALRMSVGDSYTVRCALASDEPDQSLKFASSDAHVASIATDGTVYALAPGETVISARASGGAAAQMQVQVIGVPMSELKLNVDELHIAKGEISGLTVSYNADASDARLQWISSDEGVVRVDQAGRVEGVSGGSAYVSVITPAGKSASARVYVDVPGTAMRITPAELTLGVGARVQLNASYLPVDCTDSVRSWISSDSAVARVDENGELRAMGQGKVYISALSAGGLTGGMEVTVEAAPEDIQLDPARATLERGDEVQLQLLFLNADGNVDSQTSHLVVWSSSDESVAKVDQQGRVTALRSGDCRIEASADGMTASCRLKVQVTIHEITLDQQEVYLLREQAAEPIQLHWSIAPVDVDDATVHFTSNNEQVATVSSEGLVRMTGGYGTAIITASSESGAAASFTVNVVTQLPQAQPEATPEIPAETSMTADAAATSGWDDFGTQPGDIADGDDMYAGMTFDDSIDFDMYGDGGGAGAPDVAAEPQADEQIAPQTGASVG